MIKIISVIIIPLILSLATQAHASLLSIHTPAKGATVPPGPLMVTGGAISSNSTLKDCNVQIRTNSNSFVNVTSIGNGTWSTISNETTPGPNQIEAQLKCIKPDGSYLIKHNVHNFTVSAPQNNTTNNDNVQHANLTNQLVPSNFKNPSANVSRPIQNNLENITGAKPKLAPIPTLPPNPVVTSNTSSQLNHTITKSHTTDGLPIVSGHHKTIHIHFSH